MGNEATFRQGEADFREPSLPSAVKGGGSGRDRRPGPPGASPEEEARHEAPPQHLEAHLSVRPEEADRADRGPKEREGPAPSGMLLFPPQGHDQAQAHRQADRRSVDAGRAPQRRRRRKIWTVQVRMIDPKKYAEFLRTLDNPFADTGPAQRVEDIISFCARLWARTCQDRERRCARLGEQPKPEDRAQAA